MFPRLSSQSLGKDYFLPLYLSIFILSTFFHASISITPDVYILQSVRIPLTLSTFANDHNDRQIEG